MLTVSKLAHRCGLSRSTVLYYESIGLLKPAFRTGANYRLYGDKDFERLRQICVYRNAGLKLEDILAILDRPENNAASILQPRLAELNTATQTFHPHLEPILTPPPPTNP